MPNPLSAFWNMVGLRAPGDVEGGGGKRIRATFHDSLIAESENAGAAEPLPEQRERLALYERGEPCRAPWLSTPPSVP